MNKREVGNFGEKLAVDYLTTYGFKIISTNWYCRGGEIDVIAFKNKHLHFIEVKYRASTAKGLAVEAFDYKKQLHLNRAVNYFLKKYGLLQAKYQLDLICIDGKKLTYYQNIT